MLIRNKEMYYDITDTRTGEIYEEYKQYRINHVPYEYMDRYLVYVGIGYDDESRDIEENVSSCLGGHSNYCVDYCNELLLIPKNEIGHFTFQENHGFVRHAPSSCEDIDDYEFGSKNNKKSSTRKSRSKKSSTRKSRSKKSSTRKSRKSRSKKSSTRKSRKSRSKKSPTRKLRSIK